MYRPEDHTFVVCAYGDSPFLDECLASLRSQTLQTSVIVATSTPSPYINKIADKYSCRVFVKEEEAEIASDWNFAISCANTPLVTIAHQDDVYESGYSAEALSSINGCAFRPLIFFTDYGEIRDNNRSDVSILQSVKKTMLLPCRFPRFQSSRFVKRSVLSFGNPICCPSVTYVLDNLNLPVFESGFKSNVDWDAWERISREKGSFVYLNQIMMLHRIHDGSETSSCIECNKRMEEDLDMLGRFWPLPFARIVNHFYRYAQRFN